jgi:hypothetical protein
MHHNSQSIWYLEIYVQSYFDMINLTNFKHDAQNEIGLDISISKLNFLKLICHKKVNLKNIIYTKTPQKYKSLLKKYQVHLWLKYESRVVFLRFYCILILNKVYNLSTIVTMNICMATHF